MNRKTTRSAAVVAGLAAVLALSPVAGPVTTALADETAPEAIAQSVEGVDERSFSAKDWDCWTGEWHSNILWFGGLIHPVIDFNHNNRCDLCGKWIGSGDCKPGGDEKPEEQTETLAVVFHFADGTKQRVEIETPKGEQVAFGEFVEDLGEKGDGITWYWTDFEGAEQVSLDSQFGGTGSHEINVYEHKAAEPDPVVYTVSFYSDKDTKVGAVTKGAPTFEVSAYADDLATLKQLEKDGYELVWKDLETGEVVPMDTVVTEDMDLIASWQEIEDPGTDPDPEEPGTDPEKPGTGTDEPGTGSDTQDPVDDAGDKTDDTTKDDNKSDNKADDKSDDKDVMPKTSDVTIAVSGIAAAGAALAGAGAFLKRRR